MVGSTSSCPDTPAELFDAAGQPCRGRPVAYIGLTVASALPLEVLAALDRSAIPYRVLPVAVPDHLALYGPTAVVTGTAAILEHLDLLSGAPPAS
jgi:hypothetical protein